MEQKTYTVKNCKLKPLLETLIDCEGLSGVIEAISDVCFEKGQHIEETWQDEVLAKRWDIAGDYLLTVSVNSRLREL